MTNHDIPGTDVRSCPANVEVLNSQGARTGTVLGCDRNRTGRGGHRKHHLTLTAVDGAKVEVTWERPP